MTKLLLTILLLISLTAQETKDPRCKREIVETYNLNGYLSPRVVNMYICPNIKMSCCSVYDQFMMYSTWKEKIKPKLLKYYDAIRSKFHEIKQSLKEVLELDLKGFAQKLALPEGHKEKLMGKIAIMTTEDYSKMLD